MMKAQRIGAFDIASTTGWIMADVDCEGTITQYHSGSACFGDHRSTDGERFVAARNFFRDLLSKWRPKLIASEDWENPKGRTAVLLHGYRAQLLTACEDSATTYIEYMSCDWHKELTGSRQPKQVKKVVAEIVARDLGFETEDDNQSDAAGILLVTLRDPDAVQHYHVPTRRR